MAQYTVKSGQNIYDVAMTLYGDIGGLFDLLSSNEWLNIDTLLKPGDALLYHEEFVVNNSVVSWLNSNGIVFKNGEHEHGYQDIMESISEHIRAFHPELYKNISESEQKRTLWEQAASPAIVIKQMGQLCSFRTAIKGNGHLIVEWGDYSDIEFVEGENLQEVEHCYKSAGEHCITIYGDFECKALDFTGINGVYFPLREIVADNFLTHLNNDQNNKLIIHK